MTALEKRGRGGRREPFNPDEAWIEAFDTQYAADGFYERMTSFAKSKARALAFFGGIADDYYADEIVADVIDDTFEGVIHWDPKRVDLKKHCYDAIQSRIRHHCARADHFKRLDSDDYPLEVDEALADARANDEENVRSDEIVAEALDALRESAGDDIEVTKLVDGYRTGASERAELLVATGMTSAQYAAARRRLTRLVDKLPAHLRSKRIR